jgi:hypothetical protein
MALNNKIKLSREYKKAFVAAKLGYKCASPDCKWMDETTNSFGCRNINMLEIDHILGGGTEDRDCNGQDMWLHVYKLLQTTNMDYVCKYYQLLCSNCNKNKKKVDNQIAKNTHPLISRQDLKDIGAMKEEPEKVLERLKNTSGLIGEAYQAAVKLGIIKEDK